MNQISEKQLNEAEKQFKMFEALINSMTPTERSNPDLLAKVGFILSPGLKDCCAGVTACTSAHHCVDIML